MPDSGSAKGAERADAGLMVKTEKEILGQRRTAVVASLVVLVLVCVVCAIVTLPQGGEDALPFLLLIAAVTWGYWLLRTNSDHEKRLREAQLWAEANNEDGKGFRLRGEIVSLDGPSGLATGWCDLVFKDGKVRLRPAEGEWTRVPYSDVTSVQVGGRGTVSERHGGGWIGGGFGIEGAATGVLTASVLNALSSYRVTTMETLILVEWRGGSLVLLNRRWLPEQLAKAWEPLFKELTEGRSDASPTKPAEEDSSARSGAADRLRELETLRGEGLISEVEYQAKRAEVLRGL